MEALSPKPHTRELTSDGCLSFGPTDDVSVSAVVENDIVIMLHSPSGSLVCRFGSPEALAPNREQTLLPADFTALTELIDRGLSSGRYNPKTTKLYIGGGSVRGTLSPDFKSKIESGFRHVVSEIQTTGLTDLSVRKLPADTQARYIFKTGDGTVIVNPEEF